MPLEYPLLSNSISVDVQKLNEFLEALTKLNPTEVDGISAGAKRLYEASSGKWQWQLYNGTSWAPVPFLQHNVDQLDGYHAAITPAANTVAVRNASGLLQDSITGNAATASSAATLSQTLPVNKGGTGATTSEAARANLGVPPTSHASSNTTYGLGSNANYGHVRGDGVTTNVVTGEVVAKDIAIRGDSADLASRRGQIGNRVVLSGIDYNSLVKFGHYVVEGTGSINTPTGKEVTNYVDVYETKYPSSTRILQVAYRSLNAKQIVRASQDGGETWTPWVKSIYDTDYATASTPGIVKPGTGMTVDATGALNVEASSASTPGIVKSSVTAQAGAAPIGGADGSLGEDWLKKAMEAAKEASDLAKAPRPILKEIGTRSATGDWTLTDIVVGQPVFIVLKNPTANSQGEYVSCKIVSGAVGEGTTSQRSFAVGRGATNQWISSNCIVIIPTATTVVISVYNVKNASLGAYTWA